MTTAGPEAATTNDDDDDTTTGASVRPFAKPRLIDLQRCHPDSDCRPICLKQETTDFEEDGTTDLPAADEHKSSAGFRLLKQLRDVAKSAVSERIRCANHPCLTASHASQNYTGGRW